MPLPYIPLIIIFGALVIAAAVLIFSIRKDRSKQMQVQQMPSHLPFPQHNSYPEGCLNPRHIDQEAMDAVIRSAYGEWLATFMLADYTPGRAFLRMGVTKRVLKYQVIASSLGQGYAMLISALMGGDDLGAQGRFDRLLNFVDVHPSEKSPYLMSWQVTPDTTLSKPLASFTQGDLLIAYALLMADKQWGSTGDMDYRAIAGKIIHALREDCIHPQLHHLLSSNDADPQDDLRYLTTRTSDAALLCLNAFMRLDPTPAWQQAVDKMKSLLENLSGLPGSVLSADGKTDVSIYDSFDEEAAPMLFQLALASIFMKDQVAKAVLQRIVERLRQASPDGKFVQAYSLEGKPQSDQTSLVMLACMATASVCMEDQAWLNQLWDQLSAAKIDRSDPTGASLRLLALYLLSGNWWVV